MLLSAVLAPGILLGAGCSSDHHEHGGHHVSTADDIRLGPAYSECGSLTTPDVSAVVRRPDLKLIAKTPVGCTWSPNGSWSALPSVTLSWFRGSPIGREREGEERTRDEVKDFSAGGKSGFISSTYGMCVTALEYGEGQFFEVAVTLLGGGHGASSDACHCAMKLSTQVAEKV
ncbi:DUF3558 domain-containing protein [Mycobacterium sp. CBMA271]|uniref:DUF3558 family protein n=1 Tax=unclassified Mycobacteroides TaxID=2618759 RepID=UPI0012DD9EF1|nr:MULTISPECIES: DUF3558 family protein [unclassified Mycobacteroides]MUM16333.1 hypothetical protein [Mycobacteroides sp. CBMA 326]MUM22155.1 DUF3558 domain-containing protein [Mycobacteroides sp. CBMA 271]